MATKISFEEKITENVKAANTKIKGWHQSFAKMTDETLEKLFATGEQWQNILDESIQKGTQLIGKQQDLIFDSLEDVKNLHNSNVDRFKLLVDWKEGKKKAKTEASNVKEAAKTESKKAVKKTKVAVAKASKKVTKTAEKAKATVAKAAKTAVEPKAAPAKNQDLKQINGIGPKLEGLFKAAGINTLSDLASAPIDSIRNVLSNAGARYKSLDPSKWIEEAQKLVK